MTRLPPDLPPRGPIGLADALRAVTALGIDAVGCRAVLAALGFAPAPPAPAGPPPAPRPPAALPPPPPTGEMDELRLPLGWERDEPAGAGPAAAGGVAAADDPAVGVVELLADPAYMWAEPLPRSAGPAPAAAPDPLIPAVRARAVFADLLAVPAPVPGPDIPALIDRLSRCRPVVAVARRRRSVRLGAGVVLDRSRSMMPYWADLDALAGQLGRLFPADRLGVMWAAGPGDLGADPGPPGTSVLLVTDFGAADPWADPAGPAAWAELARRAAAAGRRVVVLTPGPVGRVPAVVGRYARVQVEWDVAAARAAAAARRG